MKIFYRSEWIKGWRGPHENFFEYFQIQKWMLQRIRAKNIDEENGIICLVPCVPPELWFLNCPEKCIFGNFVLTSTRNLSLLKQFTFMHLKGFVTHFRKWCYLLCYDFYLGDIGVWSRRILLNFCWISIFFDILTLISHERWLRPL